MENTFLQKWIIGDAMGRGCKLVGFAEVNEITRQDFINDDLMIDGISANSIIILAMILDDPVLDAWTQSPSWPVGKNFIDEAIARVATIIALKLTKRGYPSRTFRYGDVYLKHLSVHAGLGIIGENNLLITPEYGPHIRLRGLITTAKLVPSKSLLGKFNPCIGCPAPPPCVKACPAGAFNKSQRSKEELTSSSNKRVPRSGYAKETCREYSLAHLKQIGPFTYLWCRACEEACPVGHEKKDELIKL